MSEWPTTRPQLNSYVKTCFPEVSYSGEDQALRRTIQLASLVAALFLILGCDPGMTIREAVRRDRLNASSFATAGPNNVMISVKADHQSGQQNCD